MAACVRCWWYDDPRLIFLKICHFIWSDSRAGFVWTRFLFKITQQDQPSDSIQIWISVVDIIDCDEQRNPRLSSTQITVVVHHSGSRHHYYGRVFKYLQASSPRHQTVCEVNENSNSVSWKHQQSWQLLAWGSYWWW